MTNRIANLTFGVLIALGLLAVGLSYGQRTAVAALDCTETVNLKVYIYNDGAPETNGGLLNLSGAYVDFSDNIQTGALSSIRYYDNGANDDDDRRGIIEERTACRDVGTVNLTATLGFRDSLDCTIITPERQEVDLYEDVELEWTVDDCERVEPTATATAIPATATATPVPPSPTATLAPATATPAPLPAVQPAQPQVVICPNGQLVLATQACPVAPVVTTTTAIKPPSTGSAGMAAIGDDGDGGSLPWYWCRSWSHRCF